MITDFHTHILPHMDDGAKNTEESLNLLKKLQEQGIERVALTPHFYCHREDSLEDFLDRRARNFAHLLDSQPVIDRFLLGAEAALERGLNEQKNLRRLCFENSDYLLLELPYGRFDRWMTEEIESLIFDHKLKVILAHPHRYLTWYSSEQMKEILSLDVVFQINNEVFDFMKGRRFVKELEQSGKTMIFGSDCHNMTDRQPNWDLFRKKGGFDRFPNELPGFTLY